MISRVVKLTNRLYLGNLQFCHLPTKTEIRGNAGCRATYQNCAVLPVLIAISPWHSACARGLPKSHVNGGETCG